MPHHWGWYVEKGSEGYTKHVDAISSFFKNKSGTFCDVGCGAGLISHVVQKHNPNLIMHGCDINTYNIEAANKLTSNISFELTNLFENNAAFPYDWILCSEVIEHISMPLDKIIAALSNNCLCGMYLTTPDGMFPSGNPQHVKEFTVPDVTTELNKYFKNIIVKTLGVSVHYICTEKI